MSDFTFNTMKKSYILFLIPVALVLEIAFINMCLSMISAKSDIELLLGITLLCVRGLMNVILFKLIVKFLTTKKKEDNEKVS